MGADSMNITEKDIFDFVFGKGSLPDDIKNFLRNTDDYKEQIIFYTEMKNSLDMEIGVELKKKFADKIAEYTFPSVIHLYPQKEKSVKKNVRQVFAAASENEKPKITSKTFYDENRNFIIKLLNYESSSKIFVFAVYDEIIKDFTINLLPQNLHYHMDDNSLPLELEMNLEPESISLEFSMNQSSI